MKAIVDTSKGVPYRFKWSGYKKEPSNIEAGEGEMIIERPAFTTDDRSDILSGVETDKTERAVLGYDPSKNELVAIVEDVPEKLLPEKLSEADGE